MATRIIRWYVSRSGEPPMQGTGTINGPKTQAELDAFVDILKMQFPNWAAVEVGYA